MNVYTEQRQEEEQRAQLYDEIDGLLEVVMRLAETPDNSGANINRARQLLRSVDHKLIEVQVTDHRYNWATEKINLIDYSIRQSIESDRLQ